jgi:hypothetical protein
MRQLTVTFADQPDPAKWRAGIKLLAAIALEILAERGCGLLPYSQPIPKPEFVNNLVVPHERADL